MEEFKVVSVNISEQKGTIKTPVDEIFLNHNGVENDAHSGSWNRQISLLGMSSISKSEQQAGRKISPGEFAENITLDGFDYLKVHPLDRLTSGEVEIEITQIGKECHGAGCSIFKEAGDCVMPKEGIFARVLHPGTVKAGDTFGVVESVKAASDLYMPVSGTILSVNSVLDRAPETVNSAPYEGGWMLKIKLEDPAAVSALFSADAYLGLIN